MSDRKAIIYGIMFLLFLFGAIVFGIWARFFASCDAIDWLPAAETPARCFR